MNKTDQLIEHWLSAGPITWVEDPCSRIGLDIFDAIAAYSHPGKARRGGAC